MQFLIGVILTLVGTYGGAYTLHAFRGEWYGLPTFLLCGAVLFFGVLSIVTSEHN